MTPKPPSDGGPPPRRPTTRPARPAAPRKAAAKPVRPAAAKPGKPARPARPAQAAKPVKPAARSATPAKPVRPAQAAKPVKPAAPAAPAAEEQGALVGQTIGRSKLLERIGIGRTAVVYRALYEPLDQEVALKILLAETAAVPELVARFHSEAKAIARIDNENVLKIYDVGTEGEHHYMVVELLEGEEIYDLVQREEQIEITDALRILRQAANGLTAAHDKGIIHRDVKPQNLFLLEDGTVKVVDFGLAASFDESAQRVGTPHFMAPEVCETGAAVLASDVYALGITLYHLLIGQPPYAGESVQGILDAHMRAEPLRPEFKRRDVPKEVADVVRALTQREPETRPTAGEVVALLDGIGGSALKEKESLRGRRRRRPRSRSRAAVKRRDRQEARKSPLPIILSAVLLAGIVAAVAALSGGSKPADRPREPVAVNPPPTVDTPDPAVNRADAEALAAIEAARQRDVEKRQAEEAGREALARAKAYAREHWKDRDDTDGIIDRYRMVSRSHKRTAAGDEAKKIARQIKAGEIHPHPDRTWTSSQDLAQARKDWEATRPKVEALIAQHGYRGARKLIPVAMNDPSGKFGREIRFWGAYTDQLKGFQNALVKAVRERIEKGEALVIEHEGDELPIVRFGDLKVTVTRDGKRLDLSWNEVAPEALARLAHRALREAGTEALVQQMAFAFAHRLEDAFWARDLDLSGRSDRDAYTDLASEYSRRYENR